MERDADALLNTCKDIGLVVSTEKTTVNMWKQCIISKQLNLNIGKKVGFVLKMYLTRCMKGRLSDVRTIIKVGFVCKCKQKKLAEGSGVSQVAYQHKTTLLFSLLSDVGRSAED